MFGPPSPPIVRFLPSNVRFFGVISDPHPPLKSDIINERSLSMINLTNDGKKSGLFFQLLFSAFHQKNKVQKMQFVCCVTYIKK